MAFTNHSQIESNGFSYSIREESYSAPGEFTVFWNEYELLRILSPQRRFGEMQPAQLRWSSGGATTADAAAIQVGAIQAASAFAQQLNEQEPELRDE